MEPRYWARFCAAIDRPDLAARQYDAPAYPQIEHELAAVFETRPRAAWLDLFETADTQAMPVLMAGEALRQRNAAARGMHVALPVTGGGTIEQVGTPFRISGVASGPHRAAGAPGADRDAILGEIGLDAAAIGRLERDGLFSSTAGAA
jgi:crotonobetainyl-CoA:carnitine CoA-transferase CaiB-like acyl-CoA transferase